MRWSRRTFLEVTIGHLRQFVPQLLLHTFTSPGANWQGVHWDKEIWSSMFSPAHHPQSLRFCASRCHLKEAASSEPLVCLQKTAEVWGTLHDEECSFTHVPHPKRNMFSKWCELCWFFILSGSWSWSSFSVGHDKGFFLLCTVYAYSPVVRSKGFSSSAGFPLALVRLFIAVCWKHVSMSRSTMCKITIVCFFS